MKRYTGLFWVVALCAGCSKNNGGGGSGTAVNPAVSINDISVSEGNSGNTNFNFTVSLDRATSKAVTMSYSTQDGTAASGSDFTGVTNQTLTFQPNETSKTITIAVTGDAIKESDEKFTVQLSNVSNATLVRGTGTATIQNDDAVGVVSLVWSDEFDGTTLNTANWGYETGDGCPNVCGWGNNELEYYTDRPENAYVTGGYLNIEARKESFGGKEYTSARLVTKGKKSFKFGRMDIRAKLPKGRGIWPAIWMMPQNSVYGNWPKSGEIDIMEYLGHETNKVYGTAHFGPGPGSTQISRNFTLSSGDFNSDFHIFSIIWDMNSIKWLVDDQVYSTVSNLDVGSATYPFNEDFFFILNVAVGGAWPGNPDATTTFPQKMQVDYVRVYQ